MANFEAVGKTKDYTDGTKKKITVGGSDIMLVKTGEAYFAVSNRCPHLDASLSRGKLEGTIITCPSHGTQFDVTNGQVVRWLKGYGPLSSVSDEFKKEHALRTYNVKVEDDTIYVEI
jgi:3-phenylpropionate/trans-cinnamate dioxygenase ferredoxin subunit